MPCRLRRSCREPARPGIASQWVKPDYLGRRPCATGWAAMVDVIEEFFAELMESEYEPMLSRGSGSIRVDVEDGHATRRWLISVDRGAVSVSRRNGRADCVLRADAATFERLATGELNPLATMLRGG